MRELLKKIGWGPIFSYSVILLLTIEVIVLVRQNRELKSTLQSMTVLSQSQPLTPGTHVRPIAIQTLDGSTSEMKFEDSTKKYLLFILSTTCPHCEKTLVNWQEISSKANPEHYAIVGISIHDLERTKKYLLSKKLNFYLASASLDSSFERDYKIIGVPETILLKHSGVVERVWVGELTPEQTREIEDLIAAP